MLFSLLIHVVVTFNLTFLFHKICLTLFEVGKATQTNNFYGYASWKFHTTQDLKERKKCDTVERDARRGFECEGRTGGVSAGLC